MSTPIVIIGAGVSGLVCAIELQRAGRDVRLLDAAPEVGGRVRTTRSNGLVFDHGFQVLFTAYPTLRGYLDADALAFRRFRPAAHIVRDGQVSLIGDALKDPLGDPRLLVDTVVASAISLSDKLRLLALQRFARGLSFEDCFAPTYANISTRAFLEARGFGPAVIDGFFAPFYGGILLDRRLVTTASVLLFTFKMLAEGDTVVPANGMGAITQQLASRLRPGTVQTGVRVQRVLTTDGRVTGGQLADGTTLEAGHVVLATDAPNATALAATAGVALPEPVEALGCTTVYYTARRTPIPGTALWLNAHPQAVISHAITLTDVAPEYASDGRTLLAATAVGAPAAMADEALDAAARSELLQMGRLTAADAGLERVGLWRVPYAQFAQPPGWREQRPSSATEVAGLWRASEVLHSSSLEGAARGGLMAAQALLYTA